MAKINRLTIHITASNNDATPADIEAIHIANGWSQCGYHFLVDRKGIIYPMRPENITGAHVAGQNTGNIGISYISRGSDTDSTSDLGKYMTTEQYDGLVLITAQVCKKYDLKLTDIWGHNDFPGVAKACPCSKIKKAKKFLDFVKAKMDEIPDDIKTGVNPEMAESVDGNDAEGENIARKATRSKD